MQEILDKIQDNLETLEHPDSDTIINLLSDSTTFQKPPICQIIAFLANSVSLFTFNEPIKISNMDLAFKFATSLGLTLQNKNFQYQVIELVDFLLIELMCSRMLNSESSSLSAPIKEDKMEIESKSSPFNYDIKRLCNSLNIIPHDKTLKEVSNQIINIISSYKQKYPYYLKEPVISLNNLNVHQIQTLQEINKAFSHEYSLRHQMLLNRLEVTIESMLYSDKFQNQEKNKKFVFEEIQKKFKFMKHINNFIDLHNLFCTDHHIWQIRKITDSTLLSQTKGSIKKTVVVGHVPDRGGRPQSTLPFDLEASNVTMPSFKARKASSQPHQTQQFNQQKTQYQQQNYKQNYKQQSHYQQQNYQQPNYQPQSHYQQQNYQPQNFQQQNYQQQYKKQGQGGRVQHGWNKRR